MFERDAAEIYISGKKLPVIDESARYCEEDRESVSGCSVGRFEVIVRQECRDSESVVTTSVQRLPCRSQCHGVDCFLIEPCCNTSISSILPIICINEYSKYDFSQ